MFSFKCFVKLIVIILSFLQMRNKILIGLSLFFLFLFAMPVLGQGVLSTEEKNGISNTLDRLVSAIKVGNMAEIGSLMVSQDESRMGLIEEKVGTGISYVLDYGNLVDNVDIVGDGKVKVKAKFSAEGDGWNVAGLSTYFVLEKTGSTWLISDTDFYQKLGGDFVLGLLGNMALIIIPICLLFTAFWIWMFIDCLKRDFEKKSMWIVILLLLNTLGAILYFFMVKRKKVSEQPAAIRTESPLPSGPDVGQSPIVTDTMPAIQTETPSPSGTDLGQSPIVTETAPVHVQQPVVDEVPTAQEPTTPEFPTV